MTETRPCQFLLAGWLAIASAILLVPEIALGVLLSFISHGLEFLIVPIHVANLVIGIYILIMFRRLRNQQLGFHMADILITILIVANVIFFVIGLVELSLTIVKLDLVPEYYLSLITMILFIPFSLVTIVFGVVLLKMKDDLFGLLKPYAYTTIVSGVCGATVILAPIGLLSAVAALVILGMIFLRTQREAEIL